MKTIRVKISFFEGILGTSPADPDIYRNFIGSKAPDAATVEDEVQALGVDAVTEKSMTVFPRTDDGAPFLYDYQIKGFFKDTCQALLRLKDSSGADFAPATCGSGFKAFKKIIDGLIFVSPRQIVFENVSNVGICQRPLRANTPMGERVALSISEEIPAGASATFEVCCLDDKHVEAVREWLTYGTLRGIGQWRNSGKGRFTWEEVTE